MKQIHFLGFDLPSLSTFHIWNNKDQSINKSTKCPLYLILFTRKECVLEAKKGHHEQFQFVHTTILNMLFYLKYMEVDCFVAIFILCLLKTWQRRFTPVWFSTCHYRNSCNSIRFSSFLLFQNKNSFGVILGNFSEFFIARNESDVIPKSSCQIFWMLILDKNQT